MVRRKNADRRSRPSASPPASGRICGKRSSNEFPLRPAMPTTRIRTVPQSARPCVIRRQRSDFRANTSAAAAPAAKSINEAESSSLSMASTPAGNFGDGPQFLRLQKLGSVPAITTGKNPAILRAVSHSHNNLRVWCGVIRAPQGICHVSRHRARDEQTIGVTRRGHEMKAKPLEIVVWAVKSADLELASVTRTRIHFADMQRASEQLPHLFSEGVTQCLDVHVRR